jgi:hypothetical protein
MAAILAYIAGREMPITPGLPDPITCQLRSGMSATLDG